MTHIRLEGVRVHNLRGIQLRIPHNAVTVICGVSGSGKSSLAFDTVFAEGQRRYVETFSPQARQFLNQLERPDVGRIEGIPPAIAVRQQRRLTNRRSTVGSRTEILRYLQLLFAQLGVLHCPQCTSPVQSWTPETLADELIRDDSRARTIIAFSPGPETTIGELIHQGYTRGITGESSARLEDLPGNFDTAELSVIVDRIQTGVSALQRISEATRQAFEWSGSCLVLIESPCGNTELDGRLWSCANYSASNECSSCQIACPPLSQELLSFHSVLGACTECQGSGESTEAPEQSCLACDGTRLNEFARSVRLNGDHLPDLLNRESRELVAWLQILHQSLSETESKALATVMGQLESRLQVLTDIGLGYVSLDRALMTLSGGEARRVVMTSALRSGLINTLYVLDEPTSGMHETDIERIHAAVRRLQAGGNTVIVVEHDLDVIRRADHVVELGPEGGQDGGAIVFEGSPNDLLRMETHTGIALRENQSEDGNNLLQKREGEVPAEPHGSADRAQQSTEQKPRRPNTTRPSDDPRHWLKIRNVCCHNIDGADVDLPLQMLCAVTGVSGSGKSSLIVAALYPELRRALSNTPQRGGCCEVTDGVQYLSDVQLMEQNPLQRSRRSVPATYLGAFDEIRRLLAETHEARKRNFTPGTFSFNSARSGRCERCHGQGFITIDMQFLPDVDTTCDNCQGRRFRSDVLEIRYRDRAVDEILKMTAGEAFVFFNGHHRIQKSLNGLRQAGLDYLTLGQPLSTLSGGEAQRLRIAALLAGGPDPEKTGKRSGGVTTRDETGTLFILDEPSNGLHVRDTDRLMNCLHQLVQVGHSVVMIEHDHRLVQRSNYRIEMGPGAGRQGGRVIAMGPVL